MSRFHHDIFDLAFFFKSEICLPTKEKNDLLQIFFGEKEKFEYL